MKCKWRLGLFFPVDITNMKRQTSDHTYNWEDFWTIKLTNKNIKSL